MVAAEVCVVEKENVSVDECSEDVGEERKRFYRGESEIVLGLGEGGVVMVRKLGWRFTDKSPHGPPMLQ
ncbi:hypothetical protein HAX54_035522, partial [Datura stramonium]|nr:hypothetical protein [Datura stramonium]